MWAVAGNDRVRHFYGKGDDPLAVCGHQGETRLDYTSVLLKKCPDCLKKFPRLQKKKVVDEWADFFIRLPRE